MSDLWDEVGESRVPLRLRENKVRITGIAKNKDGAPVLNQNEKDGHKYWSVAVALEEVDGPGSAIEFFGLKKNEAFKIMATNKALGLTKDDLRKACAGKTALPGKDDPPHAEFPQDTFEAIVDLWTGKEAEVYVYWDSYGGNYPKVSFVGRPKEDRIDKAKMGEGGGNEVPI